jgi:hypothetical protein
MHETHGRLLPTCCRSRKAPQRRRLRHEGPRISPAREAQGLTQAVLLEGTPTPPPPAPPHHCCMTGSRPGCIIHHTPPQHRHCASRTGGEPSTTRGTHITPAPGRGYAQWGAAGSQMHHAFPDAPCNSRCTMHSQMHHAIPDAPCIPRCTTQFQMHHACIGH